MASVAFIPAQSHSYQADISTEKTFRYLLRVGPFFACDHCNSSTVFESHRKSLIQHCERSELRLHFEWTKS